MQNPPAPLLHMQRWLETWVIGQRLCPFARPSMERDGFEMRLCDADRTEDRLLALWQLAHELEHEQRIESALLVVPALEDFDHFLDELAMAEALLNQRGMAETWHLASFHPRYRFQGEHPQDVSHYTNRSPYPAWHLIRHAALEKATERVDDPLAIPGRNIQHLQSLGRETIERILQHIQQQGRSRSS